MQGSPLLIVHLLALAVYLGSTVYVAMLLEVAGAQAADAVLRRHRLAEIFRVYSPLTIAVLLFVVMTGAWSLTDLKESMGPGYTRYALGLIPKLSMAFLMIMNATYVTLGLGFRLVRADQGGLPVTEAALNSMKMRLRVGLWLSIVFVLITGWISAS